MSFRTIRPSFSGENSGSMSNQSTQSTSESATGSDSRRVRNEKDAETSNISTKRRRVPDSVTRNACLNCKKARAKCDGKKPCKRCASRIETSECIYEVHIKHAKEELVKQIKELMAKDHLTDQILQALSTEEQVPEILSRLKKGETYEAIVSWLGRSSIEEDGEFSPGGSQSQQSMFDSPDHDMDGANLTAFRWSSVTSDTAILDHLFQLFFAWIHPVHTLFSEGRFVDSYKHQSKTYCSAMLVNAICAMACHLHSSSDGDVVDFEQLGRDFSDAARSAIDVEDTSITTAQAFAVMFLIESTRTDALRASSYLKFATSILSKVDYSEVDGFQEVWKSTSQGVHNLNRLVVPAPFHFHTNGLSEWAQITFQVPPAVRHDYFEKFEYSDTKLDEAKWYFYRQPHDRCPAWPGLLGTTNRQKWKLNSIISEVTTTMYSTSGAPIQARQILDFYRRFVSWRRELPASIADTESNSSQALPHVLSLLILYENAVVQLLRPLLNLQGFPVATVEETIWKHAQSGLFLLDEHYRTQFTCRYQTVLQMFSVLHLADVVARFFPGGVEGHGKDGPNAIRFGIESLAQSRAGCPVANPLVEMLQKTARECSIRFDASQSGGMPSRLSTVHVNRIDDMIDACTRFSYVQPTDEIHDRYSRSFSADWTADAAAFGFHEPALGTRRLAPPSAEERGAQNLMQIRNLLNTS
ncbi:hypothetical protein B0O99DRAFT_695099 [Bisporella sp. PMI_857]|nr:hypothetical protein B0O99DRAFT_695099 [Bisporella sp. PMI_857]